MKRKRLRDKRRKLVMEWIGDNIVTIAEIGAAFPEIPKSDLANLIRGMRVCKPRLLDSHESTLRNERSMFVTVYCRAGLNTTGNIIKPRAHVHMPEFILGAVWGDRVHPIGVPTRVVSEA